MSTRFDGDRIFFGNLSVGNFQNLSVTTGENYSGLMSFTASFTPSRSLNPGETTAANIARVLATLIMDLYKPR